MSFEKDVKSKGEMLVLKDRLRSLAIEMKKEYDKFDSVEVLYYINRITAIINSVEQQCSESSIGHICEFNQDVEHRCTICGIQL